MAYESPRLLGVNGPSQFFSNPTNKEETNNQMLGKEQFRRLRELKALGASKLKVSEELNLSYRTVDNWWNRDESYFDEFERRHEFMLDNYRQYMVEILKVCPQINNTVLLRRVKDEFADFDTPATTFFRYVKRLREQTGLTKPARKFQVREVTEPGYEGQADFGQYVMKTEHGRNVRIYFFCMTLSYSRMKFAYFSVEPFTAKTTVDAHVEAFRYFGGRPQMIVYDQDKTMVVSENLGDVVFVKEFEDFIKETGFTIYLCKGYDPSTKGKVEKTVDFVKHQFLDGRIYYGIDRLNCEFLDWLDRDGNGMVNDATKKAPRELFRKEYPKLQKYYEKRNDDVAVHTVKHDGVTYQGNVYKLPASLVTEGDRVRIEKHGDELLFYLASTNDLLCRHAIASGVGNVIAIEGGEPKETTVEEVLLKDFAEYPDAVAFIKRMREQKPRYVYPQCRKLQHIRKFYTDAKIAEGMAYCVKADVCTVFELCSWLLMDVGEDIARKHVPASTFRHYKDRAEEIRKGAINNG